MKNTIFSLNSKLRKHFRSFRLIKIILQLFVILKNGSTFEVGNRDYFFNEKEI